MNVSYIQNDLMSLLLPLSSGVLLLDSHVISIDSPLSSTMLVHYKEHRAVKKPSMDLLGGFSPSNGQRWV
jgi:hypothetical protein